jgi:hypothetical protein
MQGKQLRKLEAELMDCYKDSNFSCDALEREVNAFDLLNDLNHCVEHKRQSWFLN